MEGNPKKNGGKGNAESGLCRAMGARPRTSRSLFLFKPGKAQALGGQEKKNKIRDVRERERERERESPSHIG
jgi:hypothetical protein